MKYNFVRRNSLFMPITVGKVVEGTVTGITDFGAFVQLPGGKNGLVHISEISDDYVKRVADYLRKDQKVKVKILSISDDGKVSLSIRQAKSRTNNPIEIDWNKNDEKQRNMSFEDKLSKFLKESSEKQDMLKMRESRRGFGSRHRGRSMDL